MGALVRVGVPPGSDEDACNLAAVFDEPIARPEPFTEILPVDDDCGQRYAWDGDYYPPHSGSGMRPEIVQRYAVQFDDEGSTLIHDGRSARLTKAGLTFDAYVSSAHVAQTDPGSYLSTVSLMLVRAE